MKSLMLFILFLAGLPVMQAAPAESSLLQIPTTGFDGKFWALLPTRCSFMHQEQLLKLEEVLMRLDTAPLTLYDASPGQGKDCIGHPPNSHSNGNTIDTSYFTMDKKNNAAGYRELLWTNDKLDRRKFDLDTNMRFWLAIAEAFPYALIEVDERIKAEALKVTSDITLQWTLGRLLIGSEPTRWGHDTHQHLWLWHANKVSLRSAIGEFFDGEDMTIFPIRNSGGYRVPYPAYCKGKLTVDTRYNKFSSSCETGWELMKDGKDKWGTIGGVPDERGNEWEKTSCYSAECMGWKAVVWPVANSAGKQTSSPWACGGDWYINSSEANWFFWCGE